MSRHLTLAERFAREVVAFGPIAVTRRTVYALMRELGDTSGETRRAADFFAWSNALAPSDAPPLSLAEAREVLGLAEA